MGYNEKYVKELEDLIMDRLLPGYIENCRSHGINPNTNDIVGKLLEIQRSKEEIPFLLRRPECALEKKLSTT